jgi:glycosyltransferase involved in cell wall biosynthesis
MQPTVSVIIPNLNSRLISLTLEAMQQQTFDLSRVEVIVAGRDDLGLVAHHPHVRMITASERASAAHNRNLGMAASHGDLLCFTDADCVPQPDWLSRHVAHYQNPTIDVVGGGVAFEATNYWAWCGQSELVS